MKMMMADKELEKVHGGDLLSSYLRRSAAKDANEKAREKAEEEAQNRVTVAPPEPGGILQNIANNVAVLDKLGQTIVE